MAPHKFDKIELHAEHIPDFSIEQDAAGNKEKVELPGEIHVGAMIDGVFVPFIKRKAAGLLSDIAAVKPKRSSSRAQSSSGK